MKPKNFPERKRQRRLAALDRLLDSAHSNERTSKEIAVLQDRTAANLRDIHTKKYGAREKGRIASDLRD